MPERLYRQEDAAGSENDPEGATGQSGGNATAPGKGPRMILYIVTEKREKYERNGDHAQKLKLEKISKQPCLVQFYEDVTLEMVKRLGVQAVVFSGYSTPLQEHRLESFQGIYELVRQGDVPMLGLCGGHQLICELWAEHNDQGLTRMEGYPIRKLRPGEPDHHAAYHPGWFKEWGFYPIRIVRQDPLFDGLEDGFMACEYHQKEVKELPRDFVLLASTEAVRIQAVRHVSRPIYGTQFHPENYTDYYPAGRRILENFFRIAGVL
ncbi:MAG TPA: gamma-glutamyl-gamma-aminobutyrate hydrolase family protein [Armatimonadota bacterium]|jgi:GMP synthase-like glutamine amidotransferase|nr:C26 family cysteine hydrolase domain-containing family [Armatimonadota bacterium]HOJ22904.1 gamma-glutamyl-gamma-aminobutyrate hydrolase family protein [Armatimonadota bacterium]HOM80981.1 gamma-glutamyl-gamma-aminobutyrate hydrolase family protein [Armatimonadota bacterium]HOQ27395.1 gamma-glutamyl-gamma-aminobutyrate hydrolase family protein [Armatimonadota bacterium]HPO73568.1 gamma-glutamyl-gamma-aminobutyrate hydrolase family protein [Armatimonadota bacterium]